MKRTIFALLLTSSVALSGVFATGQAETPEGAYGRQPWGPQAFAEDDLGEETTLEGSFTLIGGFPAIETSDGTYTLGAPRAAWVASTIEEGTPLEVEGYLMAEPFGPRGRNAAPADDVEGHLRVTLATIDGETYEVALPGAGPGMMGASDWGYRGHMGPRGGYHGRGYRWDQRGQQGQSRWGMMGGSRGYEDGYRRRW